MDLCTHAHDIIRTWLFSRVVRAHFENHWPVVARDDRGFVIDPDRKKMSKSKGTVVVADDILSQFGADAVRWRAALTRPGLDSGFDETQMKDGRRLAMKMLNASKFVLGSWVPPTATRRGHRPGRPRADGAARPESPTGDSGFAASTTRRPWRSAETFFWEFCDDYLELVKERAYGEGGGPASTRPGRRSRWRCTPSCGCSRRSSPS